MKWNDALWHFRMKSSIKNSKRFGMEWNNNNNNKLADSQSTLRDLFPSKFEWLKLLCYWYNFGRNLMCVISMVDLAKFRKHRERMSERASAHIDQINEFVIIYFLSIPSPSPLLLFFLCVFNLAFAYDVIFKKKTKQNDKLGGYGRFYLSAMNSMKWKQWTGGKIIYLPKNSPNNDFRQFRSSKSDSESLFAFETIFDYNLRFHLVFLFVCFINSSTISLNHCRVVSKSMIRFWFALMDDRTNEQSLWPKGIFSSMQVFQICIIICSMNQSARIQCFHTIRWFRFSNYVISNVDDFKNIKNLPKIKRKKNKKK